MVPYTHSMQPADYRLSHWAAYIGHIVLTTEKAMHDLVSGLLCVLILLSLCAHACPCGVFNGNPCDGSGSMVFG